MRVYYVVREGTVRGKGRYLDWGHRDLLSNSQAFSEHYRGKGPAENDLAAAIRKCVIETGRVVKVTMRTAAEARADEREKCARICDRVAKDNLARGDSWGAYIAFDLARAIREASS